MTKMIKHDNDKGHFSGLIQQIRQVILSARGLASKNIDTIQVLTNFDIGHRIVEHEQKGLSRAKYGENIIAEISKRLADEFGNGFSQTNLKLMRKFYVTYRDRNSQAVSDYSAPGKISQTASDQLNIMPKSKVLTRGFTLSWSHYVFLLGVDNKPERDFYEIEAGEQNWSLRDLKRQFNSGLYERLALSRDKDGIKKLSEKGHIVEKPQDLIKNPYVLEFLGIDEKAKYSESDLESAIIDKLEHVQMEGSRGFQ